MEILTRVKAVEYFSKYSCMRKEIEDNYRCDYLAMFKINGVQYQIMGSEETDLLYLHAWDNGKLYVDFFFDSVVVNNHTIRLLSACNSFRNGRTIKIKELS